MAAVVELMALEQTTVHELISQPITTGIAEPILPTMVLQDGLTLTLSSLDVVSHQVRQRCSSASRCWGERQPRAEC